jgi:hypothetical protein
MLSAQRNEHSIIRCRRQQLWRGRRFQSAGDETISSRMLLLSRQIGQIGTLPSSDRCTLSLNRAPAKASKGRKTPGLTRVSAAEWSPCSQFFAARSQAKSRISRYALAAPISKRRSFENHTFFCTGNYYRSRFAEELFNFAASAGCPGWTAISRGIAVDLGVNNLGPIAQSAVHALQKHGLVSIRFRRECQCSSRSPTSNRRIISLRSKKQNTCL